MKKLLVFVIYFSLVFFLYSSEYIRLRSDYKIFTSKRDVGLMLREKGFYSSKTKYVLHSNEEYCNPDGDFTNDFKLEVFKGDKVVIDRITGLMWCQSGSHRDMVFREAEQWLNNLNQKGYAGFNDWRYPTLEEAASLLERSQNIDELYIDPLFSKEQRSIWTGDKYDKGNGWTVVLRWGNVRYISLYNQSSWVRPVRTLKH